MTTHAVIESLAAYEAVRGADPEGQRVWWTTSPYLLVHLPGRGEDVRSPEEGLPQAEFDSLGLACLDLSRAFCSGLAELCPWAAGVDLVQVFRPQVMRCSFTALYKALLLDRVLAAAGGKAVCAGDPAEPRVRDLALPFGRFDTLYACLAAAWPEPGPSVLEHAVPAKQGGDIERGIIHRRLGRAEKRLSLLNNTPSSTLFKFWRNLQARRWWPFAGISLRPAPRRTFHVLRDCELIEEAFWGILARGGRVVQMRPLPRPDMAEASAADLPGGAVVEALFREQARAALESRGVAWRAGFAAGLGLAARRILVVLDSLRRNLPRLEQGFAQVTDRFQPGSEVLSISISSPLERLFAGHCRRRGIRVNTVEHGVTLGLSEWSLHQAALSGMAVGGRGFYHSARGAEAIAPHAPGQAARVVGLPRVTERPSLRQAQRRLARTLLDLGPDEHVVMVVCDLERNNYMYGPHLDTDLQFLTKTRQIAAAACRAFPASRVVLKLYPTQRYLDEYDFADLGAEHPNLRIVKHVDFQFIRAAADLLFTSSTQSTLGWVAGAGAPYFYLDFAWAPGRIAGLGVQIPGIDGLAAAVLPDAGQVCPPGGESLASALFRED